MSTELERIVGFLDDVLGIATHPDYPTALNGLQVEGTGHVDLVVSAVDVSEATIEAAVGMEADLMLVHHGTFWAGLQPLVGRHFRRARALIRNNVALYSAHLPLDAHPMFGNCALLMRAMDLEPGERFGEYDGAPIGWRTSTTDLSLDELAVRLSDAVGGGSVQAIEGAGPMAGEVAVVTGGGGSFIDAAANAGIDTLVTGEGAHNTFTDAHELGVNVLYGGHYATETFGVRAVGDELARRFGVGHIFVDLPSGL